MIGIEHIGKEVIIGVKHANSKLNGAIDGVIGYVHWVKMNGDVTIRMEIGKRKKDVFHQVKKDSVSTMLRLRRK